MAKIVSTAKMPANPNITKFDILPSRIDNFRKRMNDIAKAASKPVPPIYFNFEEKPAKEIPLPKRLIPRAMANQLPDTRQLASGDWVREIIPVEVIHGDLTKENFEYIGYVKYTDDERITPTSGTLQQKKAFLPYLVRPVGMDEGDWVAYQKKMMPQLQDMADKFSDVRSVNCFHCNPQGDNKERHEVKLFRVLEDHERYGKTEARGKQPLKKGDIIQIGTKCALGYTGIDVNKLGAFYQLDRAVAMTGTYGSPQNPAGWGFTSMSLGDFAERMVRFYGQREKDWLRAEGREKGGRSSPPLPLYKVENPETLYSEGKMTALIDGVAQYEKKYIDGRNRKVRLGSFIPSKNAFLLKARCFDLTTGRNMDLKKYMMQHATGQGSVEEMQDLYKQGVKEALTLIEVPMVNPETGFEIIDPATGQVKMIEDEVPSPEYMEKMLGWSGYRGSFTGKWRAKCVPIMPPATESKTVKSLTNRLISFAKNLNPTTDTEFRIKEIAKFGFIGEKTRKDFVQVWPLFMMSQFERRKKQHYRNAVKEWKKASEVKLETVNPNAQWYDFDPSQFRELMAYAGTIYSGSVSPYGFAGTYYNRGDLAMAISHEFNIVYLTPQQWDGFAKWKADKAAKEAAERALRQKEQAYDRIVDDIRRSGFREYPRPQMRRVPYAPTLTEFLKVCEDKGIWADATKLDDKDYYPTRASLLFQVATNDIITTAWLTDSQLDMITQAFRPQAPAGLNIPTPAPAPVAPTPAPAPASPSPKALSEKAKITQADAKSERYKAIRDPNGNQYVGTKGSVLSMVEGWVINKTREFGSKFDLQGRVVPWANREKVRGITLLTPDNNFYVVYHPTASPSQPTVGKYYNLFDVKLAAHDEFNGVKQNVVQDTQSRMDLIFTDATKI